MSNLVRGLIAFGVALVLVGVLVHLVAFVLAIALPLGLILIIAGVVWHVLGRKET